ncbi:MAG: hypothetical protein JSR66_30685 [Proteobacteria bacterium]|nr:hypothetical protein [Pseudomonadota bacterium]
MKPGSPAIWLLALASLTACAARPPLVVRQPVGPEVERITPAATQGNLVVYSAERAATYAQSEYPVHTAYTIYSLDNKMVRRIENLSGSFNQDPERVSLPPGRYRIKALNSDSGEVIVTVIVVAEKTTVVDLDGTALPQGDTGRGKWVRLPNGHVVGWQADCHSSACR